MLKPEHIVWFFSKPMKYVSLYVHRQNKFTDKKEIQHYE